jgi:hypothetical protein
MYLTTDMNLESLVGECIKELESLLPETPEQGDLKTLMLLTKAIESVRSDIHRGEVIARITVDNRELRIENSGLNKLTGKILALPNPSRSQLMETARDAFLSIENMKKADIDSLITPEIAEMKARLLEEHSSLKTEWKEIN